MSERDWQSSYPPDHDRMAKLRLMLARIFGDGENPLAWGFTVLVVRGIRVRLHLLFIVYLLAELIFTLPGNREGLVFVLPRLLSMLALVTLHELAHAYACRKSGGVVTEIMLWPFGGLTELDVPDEPRPMLKAALAGPLLNLALVPIFAIPLYLLTGSLASLGFNPVTWGQTGAALTLRSGETTWWLVALGAMHAVNLTLLVFNLLLPMYPLDAARILEAILLTRHAPSRAKWYATNTGLGVATGVGLVGLVVEDGTMLFALAVICGLVCSFQRRRLQFLSYAQMVPGISGGADSWSPAPSAPLVDDEDKRIVPQAQLDKILAKISQSGIASLTRKERRTLKRATESSRKSQ